MKGKSSSKTSSRPKSSTPRVTVDKDSRVDVRQIENGFIVSESGTRGKGRNKEYYSKEYFQKENPLKINGANPASGSVRFGKK